MVDIYQISGRAMLGKYDESITIFRGMEKKPKSYVGLGRRINKDQTNKLEEGIFRDSFRMYILEKCLSMLSL